MISLAVVIPSLLIQNDSIERRDKIISNEVYSVMLLLWQ